MNAELTPWARNALASAGIERRDITSRSGPPGAVFQGSGKMPGGPYQFAIVRDGLMLAAVHPYSVSAIPAALERLFAEAEVADSKPADDLEAQLAASLAERGITA